jgi:hypothetical protein
MNEHRICLLFFALSTVACGPSSEPAARPAPATATASPTPSGPSIDNAKIEEIEGWVRFKGVKAMEAQKVKIVASRKEVQFTDGKGGFAVAPSDYRAVPEYDYAEVQLGAKLRALAPPETSGPAAFSTDILKARTASECGGKPTICVAVWGGCGVVACDAGGAVLGACCGGWTGAQAPQ